MLSDPRDGRSFYVGKGVGNRVFSHAAAALDDELHNDKLDRIREIRNAGLEVRSELLRFGLTEQTAFEVEAAAIELLGLDDLTNMIAGHHIGERGRMTTSVAISLFDAPAADDITEPVLLIRIPKRWYPSMPPQELYDATAGWWRISQRREKAHYAFAVIRGVIREVYAIGCWRRRTRGDAGWEQDGDQPSNRWGFEGVVAQEVAHYRNRSARHLYRPGEASPIKFKELLSKRRVASDTSSAIERVDRLGGLLHEYRRAA